MTDGVMELLAKTSTLSDCTLIMSILADCTVNVLLSRPTDAVTEPVVILDKFNPMIADAGISNRLAPEPENDPLIKNRSWGVYEINLPKFVSSVLNLLLILYNYLIY